MPAPGTRVSRTLAVNTVGRELRELTEAFPDAKDTSVSGGQQERALARMALKELVLGLRRIDLAAAADSFDEAATEYHNFRKLMVSAVPMRLRPYFRRLQAERRRADDLEHSVEAGLQPGQRNKRQSDRLLE